jgi:hypothetical protein
VVWCEDRAKPLLWFWEADVTLAPTTTQVEWLKENCIDHRF